MLSSGSTVQGLVINRFTSAGIAFNADTGGHTVVGNYIGTDVSGSVDLGNNDGVSSLFSTGGNTIGGVTAALRNVISGNDNIGVALLDGDTNVVIGNYIGVAADGTSPLGNDRGVYIFNSSNHTIGGTAAGEANIIANSTQDGIEVFDGTGHLISGNSIYANGGLGIDLNPDGVTANDAGDGDTGANNLQNFPVLTAAATGSSNINIQGTFNGAASSTFTIEFFSSSTADPSGNGEGEVYLGSDTINTDGSGNATINTVLSTGVTPGHVISATATDASDNTSEFSATTTAFQGLIVDTTSNVSDGTTTSIDALLTAKGADTVISLGEAIAAVNNTTNGGSPDEIHFNIGGGGQQIISSATQFPTITEGVLIDGWTQGGFTSAPLIEVRGPGGSGTEDGIAITGDDVTIRGLAVTDWQDDGIQILASATNTTVVGNYIGLELDGITIRDNNDAGIEINGDGNTIGGAGANERNVISGNNKAGIDIDNADNNIVIGNYIGTDATGALDRGNSTNGILVTGGVGNQIGGSAVGEGNVISGNTNFGISLDNADNNTIAGNLIGTDSAGTADRGNRNGGINVSNGSSTNTIGGTTALARNVISGNGDGVFGTDGITITDEDSDGNIIRGNFIGTTISGTSRLGNSDDGISILNGADNTIIGGSMAGAANVIGDSGAGGPGGTHDGIHIEGATITGTVVQGNFIGTDLSGTVNLSNVDNGVRINAASSSTIGGVAAGEGNTIAFNSVDGVAVQNAGTGNSILGNSIHSNTGEGIDLASNGVTPNDSDDGDTGPNNLLNFPVLTNVFQNGANLDIDFDVDLPAGNYRIEFFDNAGGLDGSGFGEGETFVGSANITATGAAGYESFSTTLTSVTASDVLNITTTATEANGTFTAFSSTSEFGPQFEGAGVLTVNTTSDNSDGDTSSIAALLATPGADGVISLREAIEATNNTTNIGGNPDEIQFDVGGGGAQTVAVGSAFENLIEAVTIDATTQPGYAGVPLIELDGSATSSNEDGFNIQSSNNTIRGFVIHSFDDDGIDITSGTGNLIAGNYIGTDAAGTSDLGNSGDGVDIASGSNTVGGTTAVDRNVISGNDAEGIRLDGATATGNTVIGNYIGIGADGTTAVGNFNDGILLNAAPTNTIGGLTAGHRNVIGYNEDGIQIQGAGSTGNIIQGNYVGTNAAGDAAAGNTADGVKITTEASNNTVGGSASGAGNLISGNTDGVELQSANTTGNIIRGNLIGTNAAGNAAIPNSQNGIWLKAGVANTTIGGTGANDGNVVSGNTDDGIQIEASDDNTIQGNIVGLRPDGMTALGNGDDGIQIDTGSDNNTVGGTAAGAENIISSNAGDGIEIDNATNTTIHGNLIGTDSGGTLNRGNSVYGIRITNGATGTAVGGIGTDEGNTIAFSGNDGILVDAISTDGNPIRGNSIHSNTDIGIDLDSDGVTINDANDTDTGSNQEQNFPVLASAISDGANITIQGSLNSLASTTFNVDFYSNSSSEPSGFGEGEVYLGSDTVMTDGSGNATVDTTLAVVVTPGHFVSATITDPSNNTSEFSATVTAVTNVLVVDTTSDVSDGNTSSIANLIATPGADGFISLREAITATNSTANVGGNPDEIHFDITGGGPHTIQPGFALPIITEAVIIDGTTEPDFVSTPIVELDGTSAGSDGIRITSSGSTILGLVINRFSDAFDISGVGATNNTIVGNFIGTDVNGTADLGNTQFGIYLASGASNNTIGGTTAADRNVISGNDFGGVRIDGATTTGNVVQGNYIGVNVNGDTTLANVNDGVMLLGATSNTIGGIAAGAGNVISGNARYGIHLLSSADGNNVQGNLIGTNAAGTGDLGNADTGIHVAGSSANNIIGGATATHRNVISGNADYGVEFNTSTGNTLQGNYIGTDINGTSALQNDTGGVRLISAANTVLGGSTSGQGNLISGNNGHGINFGTAAGTDVFGNLIGTQANGTSALANTGSGIRLSSSGTTGITIGGIGAGEGNTIAFNTDRGVSLAFGVAGANLIIGNSIHSNSSLGIDLHEDGVTANDAGDGDSGANNLQNFPVLTSSVSTGGNTTIQGTLNSTASTTFDLHFYSSPTGDASGNGEGEVYLGTDSVITDGSGNATINSLLTGVSVTAGHVVSATATDPSSNTSEFSGNVTATSGVTVSGVVYSDEGVTPLGNQTVRVAVNGVDFGTTAESNGVTGAFSISNVPIVTDDVITVYLEDETADAVTVTVSDGAAPTIDLYQDHLITRKEDGSALTTADLLSAEVAGENDVSNIYDVSGSTLTVQSGKELLIPTSHQLTLNGTVNVHHLDIDGTLDSDSQAVNITGDVENSGTFTNTGIVTFNGTGAQSLDTGGTGAGNDFAFLTINKAGGALTLTGNDLDVDTVITVSTGTFIQDTGFSITTNGYTQNGGTFTGGDSAISVSGNFDVASGTFTSTTGTLSVGSSWTRGAGGTFAANGGTVEFDGSGATLLDTSGIEIFNGLTINKSGGSTFSIAASDTVVAQGSVTFNDGSYSTTSGDSIQTSGNAVVGAGWDGGDGVLHFTGASNQTFDLTGATGNFDGDIRVNKAAARVDLLSSLVLDGAGQDMRIVEGTLDMNGFNINANASVVVEDGGVLRLQGGEAFFSTVPTLDPGSTVTYDGAASYTITDLAYQHLTIAGTGTFQLGSAEAVAGDASVLNGVFDLNGNGLTTTGNFVNAASGTVTTGGATLQVTGDWNNTGTFTPGNGAVVLDGTNQQIIGSTTFFDLTKSVTAADTLLFESGSTQAIANGGTLTFSGDLGQLLTLDADDVGDWLLDVDAGATQDIKFVSASKSDANSGAQIVANNGTNTDNGGNTNWLFSPTVITVDTTADENDGDTASIAALVATPGGTGISLREALIAADNTANVGGPDQIHFDIAGAGPHTISLLSALPGIDHVVTIDGTSEPDYAGTPIVALDGSTAGVNVDGIWLTVGSTGSTIEGLTVHSFTRRGIWLDNVVGGNVTIINNYVGTDTTGTVDLGNGTVGV